MVNCCTGSGVVPRRRVKRPVVATSGGDEDVVASELIRGYWHIRVRSPEVQMVLGSRVSAQS